MAEEVTDANGRKYKLRDIDPTFFLSLTEAAGEASSNTGFVTHASLYMMVDEIDGVPVPFPHDKAGIYALAKLIGNAGMAALSAYVSGKKPAQDQAKAKN